MSSVRFSDIHPQQIELFQSFAEQVLQNGSAQTEKLNCITASGRSVPVLIQATIWKHPASPKLIRAVVVDNLAKQALEEALIDEVKARYPYDEIIGGKVQFNLVQRTGTLIFRFHCEVLDRSLVG